MKFIILFAFCIAAALAAPADVSIVKLEQDDIRPDGYKFA
jgi:hypothetical protein